MFAFLIMSILFACTMKVHAMEHKKHGDKSLELLEAIKKK